jgi:hypothetical protein
MTVIDILLSLASVVREGGAGTLTAADDGPIETPLFAATVN